MGRNVGPAALPPTGNVRVVRDADAPTAQTGSRFMFMIEVYAEPGIEGRQLGAAIIDQLRAITVIRKVTIAPDI